MGGPIIDVHFKGTPINRKSIRSGIHYKELDSIKDQYLRLLRYNDNIINVCEKRIDDLLVSLDENSLDRLYNDISLDKHIIVMSFSNLSDYKKYDKLRSTLPEIIINRYKNRDDVSVMYSGKIDPNLKDLYNSDDNRLLIDGSFTIDGENISINLKVYDVSSWTMKVNTIISCDVRNIECIYDDFLWHVKKNIDPLINNEIYDDFSDDTKKILIDDDINNLLDNKKDGELFSVLLEDFVVQKDYNFNLNYKDMGIADNIGSNSQDFDLNSYPNSINSRQKLLNKLIDILSKYLENPYNINIGKMIMNPNIYDGAYVDLNIPITYKLSLNKLEKLIKKFPYNTLDSRDDLYIIEFLYDNYLFDNNNIDSFNHYDNELFPVLFFSDKDGNIQKIVIDSWDSKYDNLLFGDYDVSRVHSFSQMFSVIESNKNMYLNITRGDRKVNYKITMPISILDNYTRLTVKLFSREKLDKYLPISELKF